MAPRQRRAKAAQPENNFFFVVVGLVLAVLIPLLQSNGVEVNWQISIMAYVGLIWAVVWSFLTHAVHRRSSTVKVFGTIGIIAFIGSVSVYATIKQYHRDNPPTQPTPEKRLKIRWRTQKINEALPYVLYFGGHGDNAAMSGGQRVIIDPDQMRRGAAVKVKTIHQSEFTPLKALCLDNGRVCFDLDIPTEDQPIVIKNGESGELPARWDWNSDENAMEVIDDQHRVIFQMIVISQNQIMLNGMVQSEGTILLADFGEPPWEHPHMEFSSLHPDLHSLFLYPSRDNVHKRNPDYAP